MAWRDENGPFPSRAALKKVAGLGPRAFEQCAGFLRIPGGKEPLDASAVHPEAYGVARKIVAACGRDIRAIMGDGAALKGLRAEQEAGRRMWAGLMEDPRLSARPGWGAHGSIKDASSTDVVGLPIRV